MWGPDVSPFEQAQQDLVDYGFVPDRVAALAEAFPPLDRILSEHPSHPVQRALFDAREAAMSVPRWMPDSDAWQEVDADVSITSLRARQRRAKRADLKPDGEPVDLEYLAHEAVANLKARYGGPSDMKENI